MVTAEKPYQAMTVAHLALGLRSMGSDADRRRLVLEQWWFPIDLPSVRTDALVHSPAAFRIRGIFIGTGALDRA